MHVAHNQVLARLCGAAALVFATDAVAVGSGDIALADRQLELGVHTHLSSAWKPTMNTLSLVGATGEIFGTAILIALLLLWLGYRRDAGVMIAGPAVASGLENLLKHAFQRPRPHLWSDAARINSFSFPSGHATESAALAIVLTWVIYRRLGFQVGAIAGVLAGVFTLGVGLSRIYLGVHWPSDVLGGYAVAMFATSAVILATDRELPVNHAASYRR